MCANVLCVNEQSNNVGCRYGTTEFSHELSKALLFEMCLYNYIYILIIVGK